jgi:hypothetical protein
LTITGVPVGDDPYDSLAAHLDPGPVDWVRLRFTAPRPAVAHPCARCRHGEWRQDGDWAVCVVCERKGRRVVRWMG